MINKSGVRYEYSGPGYLHLESDYPCAISDSAGMEFGMQLLYFWLTSTYPKTIKKTGINLSSLYDFEIDESHDGKLSVHINKEWQGFNSVFEGEDTCIENMSAIVGSNGVGKTTILRELLEVQQLVLSHINEIQENSYCRMKKYVLLFLEEHQLYIYTSEFDLNYDNLCELDLEVSVYTPKMPDKLPFYSHTLIYLSNSAFTPYINNLADDNGVRYFFLTPSSLDTVASKFYDRLFELEGKNPMEIYGQVDGFAANIMKRHRDRQDFQQLIDILYWNEIGKSKLWSEYEAKAGDDIGIWIEPISHVVTDYLRKGKYLGNTDLAVNFLMPVYEGGLSDNIAAFLPGYPYLIRILYYNLICELLWIYPKQSEHEKTIESIKEMVLRLTNYSKTVDSSLRVVENTKDKTKIEGIYRNVLWPQNDATFKIRFLKRWIFKYLKAQKNIHMWKLKKKYFRNAINEIGGFSKILSMEENKVNIEKTFWKKADGWLGLTRANSSVYFHRKGNDYRKGYLDAYGCMLQFVTEKMESGNSFILRYMYISNLNMSSGERAFQNFFSWLDIIPRMLTQGNRGSGLGLRDNILLLIDEADLYMHPQWQKGFVKILKENLDALYKKKRVQVIMTTHSPMCLSDFPRENCVYLKYNRGTNERIVLPRNIDEDGQTFGRDIYTILGKSFFLSGSPMGDYVDGYIKSLLKDIFDCYKKIMWEEDCSKGLYERGDINSRLDGLERRMRVVGNIPIKRKVESMLSDMRGFLEYVLDEGKS